MNDVLILEIKEIHLLSCKHNRDFDDSLLLADLL